MDNRAFSEFFSWFVKGYSEVTEFSDEWLLLIPHYLKSLRISKYVAYYQYGGLELQHLNKDEKDFVSNLKYGIENDLPVLDIDFAQIKESGWKKK